MNIESTDELFTVFLPTILLDRVRNGDTAAIDEAKAMLHNVEIYDHFFSPENPRDWSAVALGELESRGVIDRVILKARDRE